MSKALQVATYIVTWTSFLLAIATCILRCYCCKIVKRNWKADDFMSLVVGVFLLGALGLWQRAFSLGCSGSEPNACNYLDSSGNLLTWFFITSITYDAVLHFIIRAAFFTFYLQFSAQSDFRFCIGMGFGMDGMLLIFNVLIIVFRCRPITAAFKPAERMTAQCMYVGFALFAPAILNNLLNLYVLILPLPIFYSIQLPNRYKLYICCVFAVGGAAVTLGFIRMHALHVLNTNTRTSEVVGEMMIEGAIGMSLAAVAHNLPSMRVLWTHVMKSRLNKKRTSYRPRDVESKDKLQPNTTFGLHSTVYGNGSFSRPKHSVVSATSLVDRPLPALPNGVLQLRYPNVNGDFGTRPRTPPRII